MNIQQKQKEFFCFFNNILKCHQLTDDLAGVVSAATASIYFNVNQYKCFHISINSCNYSSCVNINYSNYEDLSVLTKKPKIMNIYVCLGIEATKTVKNQSKYFTQDSVTFECKKADANVDKKTLEEINGNRNICLAKKNNRKRWLLQIGSNKFEMRYSEFLQINTCNYNQNQKLVLTMQIWVSNLVVDEQTNVNCDYFDTTGQVSYIVCLKQMCKFDESYKCIDYKDYAEFSQLQIGSIKLQCLENKTKISNLSCNDYLNKKLCLQVTKVPHMFGMYSNMNAINQKPRIILLFHQKQVEMNLIIQLYVLDR